MRRLRPPNKTQILRSALALSILLSISCGQPTPGEATSAAGETEETTSTLTGEDWQSGLILVWGGNDEPLKDWAEDGQQTYDVFPGATLRLEYRIAGRSACDYDSIDSNYQWHVTDYSNSISAQGCSNTYVVPNDPDFDLREQITVRYDEFAPTAPIRLRFVDPADSALHLLVDVSANMAKPFERADALEKAISIVESLIASDDLPSEELVGLRVFGLPGLQPNCADGTDQRLEFLAREVNRHEMPTEVDRIRNDGGIHLSGPAHVRLLSRDGWPAGVAGWAGGHGHREPQAGSSWAAG